MMDLNLYRGKRVFVTGHTGFKGSWLCMLLRFLGAEVTGYALEPPTTPSLFEIAGLDRDIQSIIGDVRDYGKLKAALEYFEPEIVFHMAAQPLVRAGYREPRETYETNVMGTVNILECVRNSASVRSFLNVTTDKVYRNREWMWGYRENEELDGYDPYSNSKSCSELATGSYRRSFFADGCVAISTARAGNVIGGGDFAEDRIIPDCVRAALAGKDIAVRNPHSIRPYQHVLEPLSAYLLIAAEQYRNGALAGNYNVGPNEDGCMQTGELVDLFVKHWGTGVRRVDAGGEGPHEANYLKLDCSLIKETLGWKPRWSLEKAVEKTVEWTKCWARGGNVRACMNAQIEEMLWGKE